MPRIRSARTCMRSVGGPLGVAEERVDIEKREDKYIHLRRYVLLRRVDRVDLQEVLDRYRVLSVEPQSQVLNVHRLSSRIRGHAHAKRERNLVAPGFRSRLAWA